MATVTGLTKERMIAMENATVVDGDIVGNDLILLTRDGTPINAGNVRGPQGIPGASFITCTSTTRPTFGPADEGKAIYETDTKLIRIWTGTRWRLQEKIICTSSTRPALVAADEGVKIYETDTDLEFTWTGTSFLLANSYIAVFATAAARTAAWPSPPEGALSYLKDSYGVTWMYAGPPAGAWQPTTGLGRVASIGTGAGSANGSGGIPAYVPGFVVTWIAQANRFYKITLRAHAYSSVVNDVGWWTICDNASSAVKFAANTISPSNVAAQLFEFSYLETGLSGSVSRKVGFYPPAGGGILNFFADATRPAMLLVEDVGI